MWSNFLKVFDVDLANCTKYCGDFFAFLSPIEQARSQRLKFDYLQNNYILTHGLLRCFLSFFTGIKPQDIYYSFGPFGKPFLKNSSLHFNMSHSETKVLYAFSDQVAVGVDVEFKKTDKTSDDLPWNFLEKVECDQFEFAKVSQKNSLIFYRRWSQLESYLKAKGLGLGCDENELKLDYHNWIYCKLALSDPYVGCLTYQNKGGLLSPIVESLSEEAIANFIESYTGSNDVALPNLI